MQIRTTITAKDWEQLGKILYAGGARIFAHLISLVCFWFAFKYYRSGQGSLFTYYLMVPFVIEGLSVFMRKRKLDTHMKFFAEYYKGEDVKLLYTFNEDNFTIDNENSGDRMKYGYDILAEFVDTEDNLIIPAYGKQFFIINKEAAGQRGLKEFLLKKNPDIKQFRKKFLGIF